MKLQPVEKDKKQDPVSPTVEPLLQVQDSTNTGSILLLLRLIREKPKPKEKDTTTTKPKTEAETNSSKDPQEDNGWGAVQSGGWGAATCGVKVNSNVASAKVYIDGEQKGSVGKS